MTTRGTTEGDARRRRRGGGHAVEAKEQADEFDSSALSTAGAATRVDSSALVVARAAAVGHGQSVSMA
jgi:hypothetical protein